MTKSLLAVLADYLIVPLLFIPVVLWARHDPRTALRVTLSGLLASWLTWGIKNYFYLPRPFILTGTPPAIDFLLDGSFPSGHTALSLGLSFALFPRYPKWAILFISISFFIGVARVLAGVHTPADVLGAILVGLFSAIATRQRH